VIAAEIAEDLQAALDQFALLAADLRAPKPDFNAKSALKPD
jgi:hypothetical protein